MIKYTFFIFLIFLLPAYSFSESIYLNKSTLLSFTIPESWSLADSPPHKIVEEIAEHIGHEAESKGHSPPKEKLFELAYKRLKTNEVILFNKVSGAYLTLDFSRLKQGESAPNKNSIKMSAKYAGDSLKNEEGIAKLKGMTSETMIHGASHAYRYDADYYHHDEKIHFSGIVGFSSPYWFYLYFTDYLVDPDDAQKAEIVFKSVKLQKASN